MVGDDSRMLLKTIGKGTEGDQENIKMQDAFRNLMHGVDPRIHLQERKIKRRMDSRLW